VIIRPFTACTLVCLLAFSESLPAQQIPAAAAPAQSAAPAAPEPPRVPVPNTLMDGTAIKLRLAETISSADAKTGQQVPFEVTDDVVVQGVTVIPKGAPALASVTEAEAKKRMGRGGKLNVNIDSVRLADGEKVQLRAVKDSKGGGHVGAMTGAMVATAIVFFPAAPLFLFMKGKDITIPKGTEVTAFVQGDMKLDMAKFGAPMVGPAAAPANVVASITVESSAPGADIEVDGNFVGNTPSKVDVTPGSHAITVKKKGYQSWTRTMNVSGVGAKINAELEQQGSGTK
jgi:hypothetical protein